MAILGLKAQIRTDATPGQLIGSVALRVLCPKEAYTAERTFTSSVRLDNAGAIIGSMEAWQSNFNGREMVGSHLICNYNSGTVTQVDFWNNMGYPFIIANNLINNEQSYRLVFNNGSYIRVERTSSGSPRYQLIYYKPNGASVATFYAADNYNTITLPFLLLNNDFTIRDPHPRWLETNGPSNAPGYITKLFERVKMGFDLTDFYNGITPVDLDDPYQDIPNSDPSGPAQGVGIPSSDPVDFPGLPSFSATDTGFITLFNPTLAQVKTLADYMWNGLFDVNNLKKLFANPMDCILGFNMLPVSIPNLGPADVCIGNLLTTVSMNVASSQWVEVDCGHLDLGLPYGSYLDFSPYTKYSIYLPYIGTCELSADDVAGKVLRLKYHVDVLSCSCVAYLKCGDSVLYQWTGSCGYSIPLTQNDFSQVIANIIAIATTVGSAVVSGGAAAPVAAAAGKKLTAKQAARAAARAAAAKKANTLAAIGAGESVAKSVMSSKPEVHRTGTIGSSAGIMGLQQPYLIIEIPKACKPAKQYHYLGYPSFTTVKLGDVSGYQEFTSIILDGIPCTEDERDMLLAACEGGIYL